MNQLSTGSGGLTPTGAVYGLTDIGKVRSSNEDHFLINEALGLLIVGDGMGGHEGGEVASAAALAAVEQFLVQAMASGGPTASPDHDPDATRPPRPAVEDPDQTLPGLGRTDPDATLPHGSSPAMQLMRDAMLFANEQVFARNQTNENTDGQGMGTTVTGIWRPSPQAPIVVFHVGDSRLYRYRDGLLEQATHDHTLYQLAVDMGGTANLPGRNLLLQAIGPMREIEPEVRTLIPRAGDIYLLCTDGLHGAVEDAAIAEALAQAQPTTLDQTCVQLVGLANATAGKDNVTVLVLWCTQ